MNDEHRKILRDNFVRLQDEMDVNERFLSHFVRNQILIDNQIDEILVQRTRYAKTREFLTVIQRRGPAAWDVWYNALIATWQYEVADILKPELAPSRHRGNQEHPTSGGGGGGHAQAGSSRNTSSSGGASAGDGGRRGPRAGRRGSPMEQGGYGSPMQQGGHGSPMQQGGYGRSVQQGRHVSLEEPRMEEFHYSYGDDEPRSGDSFPTARYHTQPHESRSNISERSNQPQAQLVDEPMDERVTHEFSDSEDPPYLNGERTDLYFIDLTVKKTENPKFVRMFHQSGSSKSIYHMQYKKKGRALIIHNQYFDQAADPREGQTRLKHRDGSEIDKRNLKTFFPRMGIEPIIHDDVRSERLLPLIERETKHPDHKKSDLFVLVIMSHGNKDIVYGADGVPVKLLDIYDKLSSTNFPAMIHKPKIVLIQACAGDKIDEGHKIRTDGSFGEAETPQMGLLKSSWDNDASPDSNNYDIIRGLEKEDFLIVTACFDSYMSMRHIDMGTWFIRGIIDVFSKHAAHRHVEELIKEVRKRVKYAAISAGKRAKDRNLQGQVVVTRSTLTHDLYLFPGLPAE